MKKLHVALLITGAFTGSAFAQTNVEVYGVVDMGFVRDMGTVSGLTTGTGAAILPTGNKFNSGAQSGTRLGFKGSEDLGGGLKALFVLETGIAADTGGFTQGNLAFARQSFVGVQSGFGTVSLGRQYTSYFLTLNQVADPFNSGLAGNAQNLMLPPGVPSGLPGTIDPATVGAEPDRAIRMNNAVKYATPIWNGLSAEIAYGFGEVAGNNRANRVLTSSVGYSVNALNVSMAYYRKNNRDDTDKLESVLLAANYDFGPAKVFAAYADNDWFIGKSRDLLIGATVPFGPHKFIGSYIKKTGRGATDGVDADQWALGYTYNFSKRTNLYAAYGQINNDGGATYTVGNNSENGTGNKAFNLGVRHTF
jgi:predicted porin